jgi:translocation and assembly module TamB
MNRFENGEIALSRLVLDGESAMLTLSGEANPDGAAALTMDVIVSDLAGLSSDLAGRISGSAQVNAVCRGDWRARSGVAIVRGSIRPGKGSSPSLRATLGQEVTFSGELSLPDAQRIEATNVRAEAESFSISAAGDLDRVDDRVKGEFRIGIPRVSALTPLLGVPVGGSTNLEGTFGGSVAYPEATIGLTGKNIGVGSFRLDELAGTMLLRVLSGGMEGKLLLQADRMGVRIEAETDFDTVADRLSLSDLKIWGKDLDITGELNAEPEEAGFGGMLKGSSEDLSGVGRFLGEEIDGWMRFEVNLTSSNGRQDGHLSLEAGELVSRFARIERAGLEMDGVDLFEEGEGSVDVRLVDLEAGDLTLSSAGLQARGHRDLLTFQGNAGGSWRGPLVMEWEGDLASIDGEHRLNLNHLQGTLGEFPVTLRNPAAIRFRPQAFTIDEFSAALGSGRLDIVGDLGPESVDLSIVTEGLPLGLLQLFGLPGLTGFAGGTVRVTGAKTNPRVDVDYLFEEIHSRDPSLEHFPSATIRAKSAISDNTLSTEIVWIEQGKETLHGVLSLPMVLSLSPVHISSPPEGEVSGTLQADIDLEKLIAIRLPEDQRMRGRIAVTFGLQGTVGHPRVLGDMHLSAGRYENMLTGTVLREIEAGVVAEGRRIELRRLHARDGKDGTLSGTGWVELDADRDYPFTVELTIENAQLVQRDDVTATLGGRLVAAGSMVASRLEGRLTARSADVFLPERTPVERIELQVIERYGSGSEEMAHPPTEKEPGGRLALDLGIVLPGGVFLRGRGLDSEWKGEIRISGEIDDPRIVGDLSIVRGRFVFFDRRFELKEGKLVFRGLTPPDPIIELSAETRIQDLLARLQVSGPVSNPEIVLQSEPPLPSDEIMARILFGRSLTRITPLQAILLAQAVRSTAGGGGTLDVMNRTRKMLSLDELEIRQEGEDIGQTQIGVGKYVREDVFLRMEKSLGSESSRVQVEVEVTPNLSIESDVGMDDRRGVGVNWKHDY